MAWGSAGGWGGPAGWTGGFSMPSIGWTPGGGMGGADPSSMLAPLVGAATQATGQKPSMSTASAVPKALAMSRGNPQSARNVATMAGRPMQAGGEALPPPTAGTPTPFDLPPDPQMLARLHHYATTRGITPEPGIGHPIADRALEEMSPFLLREILPILPEFETLPAAGHRTWKDIEERTKALEDLPVIREPTRKRYIHAGSTKSHAKKPPEKHRRGGVAKKALLLAKRRRRVAGSR